jgi:hypothetical protein
MGEYLACSDYEDYRDQPRGVPMMGQGNGVARVLASIDE